MHILITGAAGSSTSTLAHSVGFATHARGLESDDFFWRPTDPLFQEKFGAEERTVVLLTACHRFFWHTVPSFTPSTS